MDQQLSEYALLYAENEEAAWIDRIEERCGRVGEKSGKDHFVDTNGSCVS